MNAEIKPAQYLDLKGLKCPLPVLRANKALRGLETGAVIEITATDQASAKDFETYCQTAGHTLLAHEELDGVFTFRIQKGE
jgi:tRNA 2-thiouridine synthesizing protein A